MKLRATGKRVLTDGNGNQLAVSDTDETVQEVWISSSGSFDSLPLDRNVGLPPYKLPTADRQQILDEAYRLWKYDPLGGNIVRTTTYFTLGRGLVFQFDDDEAQFYATKFYYKNNLEIRLRAASDELSAFGEVYIWLRPKFVEERRGEKILWRLGDTQVTFIPPENITNIETADNDVGDIYNFIMEWEDPGRKDHIDTIPHISKYDVESPDREKGCIIQIKLNAGNVDAFGHSDLIPIKEWLDNYQEYLRDGVIINKLYRSPCYDISIEDGNMDEVNAAVARYRGWSIGSNPVHNSRESWKILEFTGPNSSNEQARRALLLIIAAGVGFAEFMLADGSNSNLASSKSQQLPVIKKFEDRQDLWAYYVAEMFQFALKTKTLLNSASGLAFDFDREGDLKYFKGNIEFPAIVSDREIDIAQTNKIATDSKYMSLRTAAARMNLDFDREIEQSRNDVEKLKELKDMMEEAGLSFLPPKPGAMTMTDSGAPQDSGGGERRAQVDTRKRDRSRDKGGADAPVQT